MNREVRANSTDGGGSRGGQFAEQLRDLRERAGRPSFRAMAGRSGRISHTTLHEAAAGHRFPSWETTREFVRACGADEAEWRAKWELAQPANAGASRATDIAAATARSDTLAVPSPAAGTTVDATPATAAVASGQLVAAEPDPGPMLAGVPEPVRPVVLVTTNRPAPSARSGLSQDRRSILWAAATVLVVLSAVALLQVIGSGHNPPAATAGGPAAAAENPPGIPASADPSAPLIPGDASRFVADVTVPDGSHYKVNQEFTKVWSIANTGTVGWHGRYLVPKDPPRNGDGSECRYPPRVPIGDTLPGEQVHISVRVVAARKPGVCWVGWKMVDAQGRMFFPSRRPVFFLVNVDQ
ncbi:NBR1-Ig-like domain-containing protein [Krasilnikovia sp. MM14-A1004]|uniref:NBR1-Ig-like domain-containing protein n=1 Tax=Krasilnikovia sp. MM14-A1004 TaxID=3373541 RepID=UPI00399CDFC3